jgi:hypothetical protein
MPATNRPAPRVHPFTVIGFSVADEVLCPTCLRRTTPITGEKLSHVCRRGPQPVPGQIRRQVLSLDERHLRPGRIAEQLGIATAMVMRILSGDDAEATTCPACESSLRTANGEILPLYYGDSTVHEELCSYCGHELADLASQHSGELASEYEVEHTTHGAHAHPALQFDRRPPEHLLLALKNAGWCWRPRERIWVDYTRGAEVPSSLPTAPKSASVMARPPPIRRRANKGTATSQCLGSGLPATSSPCVRTDTAPGA